MKINKSVFLQFWKSVANLKFNEVRTDKALLIYDGEALVEGTEVLVEVEGDFVAPEDGEYVAEDGRVLTVEGGKVTAIKPKEEEPAAEESLEEEVPVVEEVAPDEKDLRIEELEAALAERDAEIEALKQRIAELEDEAEAPAAEEVEIEQSAQERNNNTFSKYFN